MNLELPNPIKILLADDDEDDRELFLDLVNKLGKKIELDNVRNGKELLERLSGKQPQLPDMVFLDLNMPGKDGRQCLKEVRALAGLKNLPVVICSTSNSNEDIDYAFSNGADLYLVKPIKFSKYLEHLSRAISLYIEKKLPVKERERFVFNKG